MDKSPARIWDDAAVLLERDGWERRPSRFGRRRDADRAIGEAAFAVCAPPPVCALAMRAFAEFVGTGIDAWNRGAVDGPFVVATLRAAAKDARESSADTEARRATPPPPPPTAAAAGPEQPDPTPDTTPDTGQRTPPDTQDRWPQLVDLLKSVTTTIDNHATRITNLETMLAEATTTTAEQILKDGT